jgi:hypothetical protein
MPLTNGIVRQMPTRAPDTSTMALFGPGVPVMTTQKIKNDKRTVGSVMGTRLDKRLMRGLFYRAEYAFFRRNDLATGHWHNT